MPMLHHKLLIKKRYIYYEKYNKDMPYRRFFIKVKDDAGDMQLPFLIKTHDEIPDYLNDNKNRVAHIHILPYNSEHWVSHITFRDFLRAHPGVRDEYRQLKELLVQGNGKMEMNIMKEKILS